MSTGEAGPAGSRRWLFVGLFAGLIVVWLIWTQWSNLTGMIAPHEVPSSSGAGVAESDVIPEPNSSDVPTPDESTRGWEALIGEAPLWPADFAEPADCAAVEARLAQICRELDVRQALGATKITGGTCGLIREVAEQLAARPPVLDSELKSYQAILANVFHLFRVTGRERIVLLREVMVKQGTLDEPVAMALYRWLVTRERCARSGETPITQDVLYAYAGFLLETLGGQAYLRRRSPRHEALASFYALMLLERSVARDQNPQGIDPRADIARTRALIAAQPFVFGSAYGNLLDAMEARWERLAAPPE